MAPQKFAAAAIQLNAGNDLTNNLLRGTKLIREAAKDGAQFVALPENSFFMRGEKDKNPDAEIIISAMQKLAAELKIWLLFCVIIKADSQLPRATPEGKPIEGGGLAPSVNKNFNRSILLNAKGRVAAHYDKIHLFDVDIPGGESHRESDKIEAGDKAVSATLPWGKLGMVICYDLRFPQLFRALTQGGAQIITVPSAFTYKTGTAHWHALLCARAIENSCYIIAPAQCGKHPKGRQTYGHSLIIDPWGKIVAEASEDREEVVMAEIDLGYVAEVRKGLPSLRHDRKFSN